MQYLCSALGGVVAGRVQKKRGFFLRNFRSMENFHGVEGGRRRDIVLFMFHKIKKMGES
jgi:hypothetical protein